jgi:hypothetical protein
MVSADRAKYFAEKILEQVELKLTLEELHARIGVFNTRIELKNDKTDLKKEELKSLECERSLVQRRLNTANNLDPVARLPPDISHEIFLQTLDFFPMRRALCVPILLLSICSAWIAIMLDTPALWATITIHLTLESLRKSCIQL